MPNTRREDLGKGVRGKYFKRYSKGTNLVLLDDKVAKAFPTAEAVNEALLGLLALTEKTARLISRPTPEGPQAGCPLISPKNSPFHARLVLAAGVENHRLDLGFKVNVYRVPVLTRFAWRIWIF